MEQYISIAVSWTRVSRSIGLAISPQQEPRTYDGPLFS